MAEIPESPASPTGSFAEQQASLTDTPEAEDTNLSHLECPACSKYLASPIKLCKNGHSLCGACFEKCKACPKCKVQIIQANGVRNFALENIIATITFPCPNKSYGCNFSGKVDVFRKHLDVCVYRGVECPLNTEIKCSWKGRLEKRLQHVNITHSNLFHSLSDTLTLKTLNMNRPTVKILNFEESSFVFMFRFNGSHKPPMFSHHIWCLSSDQGRFLAKITLHHPKCEQKNFPLISNVEQLFTDRCVFKDKLYTRFQSPFLKEFVKKKELVFKVVIEKDDAFQVE